MFIPVCFLYDTIPYQESTTLQLWRTAAAVGNTIYVRSLTTDSRQHAESTAPACDALPASTPLTHAAATAASAASVKWHAGVKCKDCLNITLAIKQYLYLCSCLCSFSRTFVVVLPKFASSRPVWRKKSIRLCILCVCNTKKSKH